MKGKNAGEWSELYAFFKLLGDGVLHSADKNLNRSKEFFNIRTIFREEKKGSYQYERDTQNINIIDSQSGKTILSIPFMKFDMVAQNIVSEIKLFGKVKSIPLINEINSYKVNQVKTGSSDKGDIDILIYDPEHSLNTRKKFSIKSLIGSKPTLFNANKTTNIEFEILDLKTGGSLSPKDIIKVNAINSHYKYVDRCKHITSLGYLLKYNSFEDSTFRLNLEMIDSKLPEIIAFIVKDKFLNGRIHFKDIFDNLKKVNPLNYDLSQGHEFYEYRLTNFLVESALGMTSKKVLTGRYDVIGGVIVVKPNTDILCFHLIDFNNFKDYLVTNAKVDSPGGSKMGYGTVYEKNGKSFIKLNFQIKI